MAQLLGAIAEFERSLITERVRAGIRNARNKGRTLGRPRLEVDGERIARLRKSGASLRAISKQLGISLGSVHRALRSNNP
jgi:DNA invertase Pin-like site-specific DNA recombinase